MSKLKGYIQLRGVIALSDVYTDTGVANAYVVTLPEPITSYTNGLTLKFKAVNANTGASTINIDGLGVKSIVKNVSTALAANDILAGQIVTISYDGTNFQIASGAGGTGTSGFSGYSGASGLSGYSGFSGRSGYSGYSGATGASTSGFSGYSGSGLSGYSGFSGATGSSTSGYSGYSGVSYTGARVQSVSSSATVTPSADNDDLVIVTAQAASLALANPTGTPTQGQVIEIRIKDNGTARAISYGTQYRAFGQALPTTTTISKTLYITLKYNATDTKWDATYVQEV